MNLCIILVQFFLKKKKTFLSHTDTEPKGKHNYQYLGSEIVKQFALKENKLKI